MDKPILSTRNRIKNSKVDNLFAKFNDKIEQVTISVELAHAEIVPLKSRPEKLQCISNDIEKVEHHKVINLEMGF